MRFETAIDSMRDDIIKTTQELISYKSVEEQPEPGAPFGRPIRDCLDRTLELCEEMGFKTVNVDGYAGHAEYGQGEEIVGILVHLDVVPEGTGWSVDPYEGKIVDGKLYGRGSGDDKGPAAAAMYALKAVKEAGDTFNKRVRIIFGCDEETGRWACMKNYFKQEEMPSCGFSPDADFPIINSEKGIAVFEIGKKFKAAKTEACTGLKIKYIKGGSRPNMVPEYCECELEMQESLKDSLLKAADSMKEKLNADIRLEFKAASCLVKSYGVSAHGSTPEKGVNAITQLIRFLSGLPLCEGETAAFVKFIDGSIGMETDGKSFGLNMEDEASGKLVFNLGIFQLTETEAKATINIRYPVTKTWKDVYAIIDSKVKEAEIEYKELSVLEPLYVPADNPLVQKLKAVYERVTKEEATLISIGGGTYARAIKNAVAFGPLFPGKPELAHQKDEYISVDDLIKCTKIYAEAIAELIK